MFENGGYFAQSMTLVFWGTWWWTRRSDLRPGERCRIRSFFLARSKELALWWEVVNRKNPLVMTNSSPWFVDGPFIEIDGLPMFSVLKNGGSFHGELLVITRGYLATWLIWESKCRVGTGSCCSFFPWSPAENGSGMTRGMTSTWNYSVIIRPGKPLELKQANDDALTGGKCQEMDVVVVFFSCHFLENSVNSMDVLGLLRWVDLGIHDDLETPLWMVNPATGDW